MSPARLALVGKGGGTPCLLLALALAGVKQMDWPADGLSLMVKGKVECVHEVLGGCTCRLQTNDGRTSFDVFFKEVFSMIWSWL